MQTKTSDALRTLKLEIEKILDPDWSQDRTLELGSAQYLAKDLSSLHSFNGLMLEPSPPNSLPLLSKKGLGLCRRIAFLCCPKMGWAGPNLCQEQQIVRSKFERPLRFAQKDLADGTDA